MQQREASTREWEGQNWKSATPGEWVGTNGRRVEAGVGRNPPLFQLVVQLIFPSARLASAVLTPDYEFPITARLLADRAVPDYHPITP